MRNNTDKKKNSYDQKEEGNDEFILFLQDSLGPKKGNTYEK